MLRMPDGNTTAILQGKRKIEIKDVVKTQPYLVCNAHSVIDEKPKKNKETKALLDSIRDMAGKIIELSPNIPSEANFALKNIDSPNFLINFISSNLNVSVSEKQNILGTTLFSDKASLMLSHLNTELQHLELKNQIQSKLKSTSTNSNASISFINKCGQFKMNWGKIHPIKTLKRLE
jgi:ATP-dependent Lon protease